MIDLKYDHVGLAVKDLDAAQKSYEELFGYVLQSGPFDDPIQQARVAFLGLPGGGDVQLELIEPLDEKSHVARILAKGVSAYHVCYRVPDIEAALAELREKKCLVVKGPDPAVAYEGRPVAWFYTPTQQLMELVQA